MSSLFAPLRLLRCQTLPGQLLFLRLALAVEFLLPHLLLQISGKALEPV